MGGGFIGVVCADLHLPQSTSLKEKRRQLKRITQRLAQRHGCAVAEVDHHDLWQRAAITAAVVGRDVSDVTSRLEVVVRALHSDEEFVTVADDTVVVSAAELTE